MLGTEEHEKIKARRRLENMLGTEEHEKIKARGTARKL